ncbi:hypothetical protein G6F54_014114 [Rhizopus delemar]|nr:hypothetical protein G6F24_018700 [Rhizopus arrhizus]KAG1477015.1 hypothetical protein G6F54_014114 [Rhizopus delemar]
MPHAAPASSAWRTASSTDGPTRNPSAFSRCSTALMRPRRARRGQSGVTVCIGPGVSGSVCHRANPSTVIQVAPGIHEAGAVPA